MSSIGRLFIVINLILSAVFLAYAGFYLKNHDTYKQRYTQAVAEHAEAIKALKGERDALAEDVDKKKNDILAKVQQLGNAKTVNRDLEEENQGLKARLTAFEKTATEMQNSLSSVNTTLGNQMTRITDATSKWLKAEDDRSKAVADRDDFENKLTAANRALAASKARESSLVAELNDKAVEMRKLRTELDVIVSEIPDARRIASRALPKVDGTIMSVNAALGTVAISLGENQAGVKKGWQFAVHDGTTYKGEIRITDVSNNMGYGRIEMLRSGAAINKGDKATTRF